MNSPSAAPVPPAMARSIGSYFGAIRNRMMVYGIGIIIEDAPIRLMRKIPM